MKINLTFAGSYIILIILIIGSTLLHRQLITDYKFTPPQASRSKIFQIGFNKCGTTTLYDFFRANNIPSIHHDEGKLAKSIYVNFKHHTNLLNAQYAYYIAFFDMEFINLHAAINIPVMLFKELDRQYPGSKFILNTRNKEAWLKSRANHPDGKQYYLIGEAIKYKTSPQQILQRWSAEWDAHHAAVLAYFKDRPQDLLVFNLETDPPEKICAFFKDQFPLNPALFKQSNKTQTTRHH